jgi:hypothetical protein
MDALQILNGVVSLICAGVLTWLVLSPTIHEGPIIKTGLVMMIFALLATAAHTLGHTENWLALATAGLTLKLGLLSVIVGIVWRRHVRGNWTSATDWGQL